MTGFFGFSAVLSSLLLGVSIGLGYWGHSAHLLVSLLAAFLSISAHCLIFGIFTGAGKDTRELVQDLNLNPEFVSQTKAFRKVTFPPALYAILMILITAFLGGSLSKWGGHLAWVHGVFALVTFAYNIKTFWLEFRCVRENSVILKKVNFEAARKTEAHPELVPADHFESPELVDGLGGYQWGSHVFALGKFLCFMGWNAYLPYIYMKFIMGKTQLPIGPFIGFSGVFLLTGYFLRWKYRSYRPGLVTPQKPAVD